MPRPVGSRWWVVLGSAVTVAGTVTPMAGAAEVAGAGAEAAAAGGIERVSVATGGEQANSYSIDLSISADGRYVAFSSSASNLVPGDTNGQDDVFIRDRKMGVTRRTSIGPGGVQGDGVSFGSSISADGRFVAFGSIASNLVSGDTNDAYDVFVWDRRTGRTERVSVGPKGRQANGHSGGPSISADGRYVAFSSNTSNLVPGDTNGVPDVFLHDRKTGVTRRTSVGPGGVQGDGVSFDALISANGRFVAFSSNASNLVPGDTNGVLDVFLHDRKTGVTRRTSVGPGRVQGDDSSVGPSISADGRFVAFTSNATNLDLVPGDTNLAGDVFVRDRRTGRTERVSISTGGAGDNSLSFDASISANGRFVAFESYASNLVPGDTNGVPDVFLHDRKTGVTRRPSVGPKGRQANGHSGGPSLSADGCHVAFSSNASNLVPGDTNEVFDVFVRTRCRSR